MKMRKSKRKIWTRDLVNQRIQILFKAAQESYRDHPERSNRYVKLARRLSMRYRTRLRPELKHRICKKCNSYLVYGSNARARLRRGWIAITCLQCGNVTRHPYTPRKEKESKKRLNLLSAHQTRLPLIFDRVFRSITSIVIKLIF